MKKQTVKTVSTVLTIIIVLLLIGLAVGFMVKFTNGFTDDFKSFYLVYDENEILSNKALDLLTKEPVRFDCKYLFSKVNKTQDTTFKVEVLANKNCEPFEYTVDDGTYQFPNDVEDLSKLFEIKIYDGYFTIKVLFGDYAEAFELLYPENEIEFNEDDVDLDEYYFTLKVVSYNSKIVYELPIRFYAPAKGISVDKAVIVF